MSKRQVCCMYPLCFFIGTTVQAGQPQQLLASPGGTTCPTVVGNQQQQLTIQLPTQPQPIQGVKTLTYVAQQTPGKTTAVNQLQTSPSAALGQPASNLQPVKLATPTFAYTATGKFTEKLSRFLVRKTPEKLEFHAVFQPCRRTVD